MRFWIASVKWFGYLWLAVVGILITRGIVGTWERGGFSAVRELMSPFNIRYYLMAAIILSPGYGLVTWANIQSEKN
jgi:hypothetical protein